MKTTTAKTIAIIAICAMGGFVMWITGGKTGIGWAVLAILLVLTA